MTGAGLIELKLYGLYRRVAISPSGRNKRVKNTRRGCPLFMPRRTGAWW